MKKTPFASKLIRTLALTLAVISAVAAFSACKNDNGGSDKSEKTEQTAAKNVDVKAVYQKLTESGMLPELTMVPERDVSEVYGIDLSKVKQWVFALSDNYSINAGEVVIFEAVDEAAAEEIAKLVSTHLEQNKNVAKNYSPSEMVKLDPVEVKRVGNFVYFVVGNDYDGLMKIMKENIG